MSGNGSATIEVELIDVGHGDSIVLRWTGEDGTRSNIVIDGGPSGSGSLLQRALARSGADAVDLMVLTHVDSDHVDGLLEYVNAAGALPVRRYWGPCVDAFERHDWLFPKRIKGGLEKARKLQAALGSCSISSPVEGARWTSPDGGLRVTVLSPAARLLERLLIGEDALDLFLHEPMPLGWLLLPPKKAELEENPDHQALRKALESSEVTDAALGFKTPDSGNTTRRQAVEGFRQSFGSREATENMGAGPEFFGNSVLNDTSIVLLVEAQLGAVKRKLLFTGDQENFAYLLAQWPNGLGCEVVKAPHHGSRSFVGDRKDAYDAVWQWLRPRAVLVSANGRHGLPRADFRNAALRHGAAVFCTSRRTKEIVSGNQSERCCRSQFNCERGGSVRLTITAEATEGSAAACARGFHSDVMPVIEVRQHVVEPSPILSHMAENEIRKHTEWVVGWLRKQHEGRVSAKATSIPGLLPIQLETVEKAALAAGRYAAAPDMEMILERAMREGTAWLSRPSRYGNAGRLVWAMPRAAETLQIHRWIDHFALIQLRVPDGRSAGGAEELLYAADTTWLAQQLAQLHHFPEQMFEQALWPGLVTRLLQTRSVAVRRLDEPVTYGQAPGQFAILTLFTGPDPSAAAKKAAKRINAAKIGTTIADLLKQFMDRSWSGHPKLDPQWPEALDGLMSPLWKEKLSPPSLMLTDLRHAGMPDFHGLSAAESDEVAKWLQMCSWHPDRCTPLSPKLAEKALPAFALAAMSIIHTAGDGKN